MSVAHSPATATPVSQSLTPAESILRQRVSDYAELCRPRIAVLTMVSVAVGFTLASPIDFRGVVLAVSLFGIVLLVAASSILNQCLERKTDRKMARTESRPIASGRLPVAEAVCVAGVATAIGFSTLWVFVNPSTALATLATLVIYVFAYTVLKTKTSLCTTVGAIPGAMPPVLGWLAADLDAGGEFWLEPLSLFGIFFVWQFPHFLAIGWIHREDYQKAGLRMLPSFSDGGFLTGLFAAIYAAVFVLVSVVPTSIGVSGDFYLVTAIGLSVCYLVHSLVFFWKRTDANARRLLYVSLLCLPLLLGALVIDFLRLTALG